MKWWIKLTWILEYQNCQIQLHPIYQIEQINGLVFEQPVCHWKAAFRLCL